jgi:hypothetical protein
MSKLFQGQKLNIDNTLKMIENVKEVIIIFYILSQSKKLYLDVNRDTTFSIEQRHRNRKKHFYYETDFEPITDS